MKKEDKTNSIMAGLFLLTMTAVLLFAYKKSKAINTQGLVEGKEDKNDFSDTISSFSDKVLIKISEADNKLKKDQTHFNIPAGEFGLFL